MDNSPNFVLSFTWLKELEILITEHPEQGIGQEIFSMTLVELWQVYKYLERIEHGGK